jgi:hypothetical protein
MNSAQKFAWSNLIIIAATLTLTGITVAVLAWKHGIPQAFDGLGLMGLLGLSGISSAVFRKKRRQGGINFDERDRLIYEKSLTAAHSVFWPFFAAACMIPWFIFRSTGSISVYVLPIILGGGGVVAIVVQSVAILVQYGWGGKGEKS